jgi:hypothetical protein
MDPNALNPYLMELDNEEEEDEMDWELTATAAAAIVAGVFTAHQWRTERRLEQRLYLM